jgi:hypothetical protein
LYQAEEKMLRLAVYDNQDFVFANEVGEMLDLDSVSKAFSALATEVGIEVNGISLHSCWHFGATQALVAGNDLRTATALLRHADASVTLRTYAPRGSRSAGEGVTGIGDAIVAAQARRAAGENTRPWTASKSHQGLYHCTEIAPRRLDRRDST